MKIKTCELAGRPLDAMVAKCLGVSHLFAAHEVGRHHYCTDWSLGGPIMERELNNLFKENKLDLSAPDTWVAVKNMKAEYGTLLLQQSGPTPLIAGMRCFVASKMGDEVDVPEDLLS